MMIIKVSLNISRVWQRQPEFALPVHYSMLPISQTSQLGIIGWSPPSKSGWNMGTTGAVVPLKCSGRGAYIYVVAVCEHFPAEKSSKKWTEILGFLIGEFMDGENFSSLIVWIKINLIACGVGTTHLCASVPLYSSIFHHHCHYCR